MMRRLRTVAALLVLGAIVLVVWRMGLYRLGDREQLAAAMARVRALGAAKFVFVGAYAVATAVGIPASPFTLAGGVLFGAWWGMALNWTGAMLGASLGYALASSLRGPMFGAGEAGAGAQRRARIASLGGAHGAWTLFRLRAIPIVPFALLNVASAIVRMPWRRYLAATAAGIVPVTVVYTMFAASTAAGAAGGGHGALATALLTGAGVVALSFLPRVLGARRSTDEGV